MMYPRWDLATRLFHWALLLALILAWVSQEEDYIDVHIGSGYAVLALVLFRLLWGLVGSVHSRFSDFLRSPAVTWRYWRQGGADGPGHNPAAGWSILLLLVVVLAQAITGLFNSDELIYSGPLFHLLDSHWSDLLGAWHERLFWFLLGLVSLHILAVLYHQLLKRQDILWPMLDGGSDGKGVPRSGLFALLVLLLVVGFMALALALVPEPTPIW